ncbi:replication initiator protein [Blackfly microvirus SF02]|uniref:Replication initiator protein n=1 Tax=Blackfly microvirus SF02 TaxID=2576452 RepID=A0A4P8PJJ8_9VIRU|nr:replication initiator protein [Blackfly microvirus SF02]
MFNTFGPTSIIKLGLYALCLNMALPRFNMAECLTPYCTKQGFVPCGRCPTCRSRKASGWSFRLMQQDKVSHSSHFITLTYETTPRTANNFATLNKRDLQLFFKRLRKSSTNQPPIKYFACGEYGGLTSRPHYHIILFNADVSKIESAWGLGHTHFGTVTGASVGYSLKYISKKGKIPLHRNDDRVPEFQLQSRGLGLSYLSEHARAWHHADPVRMYCPLTDGKKISMPRYYKLKLYTDEQRKANGIAIREAKLGDPRLSAGLHEIDRFSAVAAAFAQMDKMAKFNDRF